MKRKFYNALLAMLGLILVMGAVGLGGCSKDDDEDELGGDVYKGYIKKMSSEYKYLTIKVTHSPYKYGELNEKGETMPIKNVLLGATQSTPTNFDLKKGQQLSFKIISARPIINLMIIDENQIQWECEIEILKVY